MKDIEPHMECRKHDIRWKELDKPCSRCVDDWLKEKKETYDMPSENNTTTRIGGTNPPTMTRTEWINKALPLIKSLETELAKLQDLQRKIGITIKEHDALQ